MSARSYYTLLGVSYNCSQADLTKAYRRLAIQLHPDKNPGNPDGCEKFKDITRAYKILSDPTNRKTYDMGGEEALKNGISQIFAAFNFSWGDLDLLLKGYSNNGKAKIIKSPNTLHNLLVSLEDIYSGKDFEHTVDKLTNCCSCKGFGFTAGIEVCIMCSNTKEGASNLHGEADETVPDLICENCDGTKLAKLICTACQGAKTNATKKSYTIHLKKGMLEGQEVTFSGEGDGSPGCVPGDRIFKVQYLPHPHFRRENITKLVCQLDIDLEESVWELKRTIKTLDKRVLHLRRNQHGKILSNGTRVVIENEGMPDIFNPDKRGKLVLELNVNFPPKLTTQQITALSEAMKDDQIEHQKCRRVVYMKDVPFKDLGVLEGVCFPTTCYPLVNCSCKDEPKDKS